MPCRRAHRRTVVRGKSRALGITAFLSGASKANDQSRKGGEPRDSCVLVPFHLRFGRAAAAAEEAGVEEVVAADDMSRLGRDQTGLAAHHEEGDDGELFETSSSVSDDDDEDQFSDGGAEEGGEQEHSRFAPQPVRRMNSDSLYDMSSVMVQLPVKKGLSRYYEGKSQSFACMSEVRCLEDLRKKENPYNQKIKSCKSYVALGRANLSLMAADGFRAPPIPVNKNGYRQ